MKRIILAAWLAVAAGTALLIVALLGKVSRVRATGLQVPACWACLVARHGGCGYARCMPRFTAMPSATQYSAASFLSP